LRNQVDAVLTGIGTVLADDPRLNVRLSGVPHERLVRVVCVRKLRIPLECQLVRTANMQATWVVTTAEGVEQAASHATELRERGVKLLVLDDDKLAPRIVLKALAREGITRVLVEAGPKISTAFLGALCVDRLYWYKAPMLLGNTGEAAITALNVALMQATKGRFIQTIRLGKDCCEILELPTCLPA
jgi:diaminohydroxyphosphoribosylaminopyrimidine deaminase/5-amino-6-(5-phosphoribosylamino)uracil reductase